MLQITAFVDQVKPLALGFTTDTHDDFRWHVYGESVFQGMILSSLMPSN